MDAPRALRALTFLASMSAACLADAEPSGPGAGPSPVRAWVEDARGRPWPADACPRAPRVIVEAEGALDVTRAPGVLLRGPLTPEARRHLAAPDEEPAPPEAQAIAWRTDGRRTVAETSALDPGAELTFALTEAARTVDGRRLGALEPLTLRISAAPAAGARVVRSWPADGTPIAPANLAAVAVGLDGWLGAGPSVAVAVDGAPIAPGAAPAAIGCSSLGWPDAVTCLWLDLPVPLVAGGTLTLSVAPGAVDAAGAAVPPWEIRVPVGEADLTPPALGMAPCAVDELALPFGCAIPYEDRATVHVRADEPAEVCVGTGAESVCVLAARGEASVELALPREGATATLSVLVTDLAGNRASRTATLPRATALPALSIDEIRANPAGREPDQEFVEVVNFDAVPIDLLGFTLGDRADRAGDAVPTSHVLAPGARALLIPPRFDPTAEGDAPVPAGTMLVRLGSALGTGGLANAGEPLYLRAPDGRRVSSAPAVAAPEAGVCAVRVSPDPRSGAEGSFAPDPSGGCTPGHPAATAP